MDSAPEIRDRYRAPGFTDTYNMLGADIVARLERHWSLGRGERRESMLPDIAELQFGLEAGNDLDKTRKRRLKALIPRSWQVVGNELANRLGAVEDVLNASDPAVAEDGFFWITQEGRRLSGEWGEVAAERAQVERTALLARMLEASQSLDQIVECLELVRWLALEARGALRGRWVLRGIVGRVRRLHDRAAELIELHERHSL
ncbi:MAG: hypothetical protein AAFQ82_12860 [Myxococcota bacterium]